RRPGRWLGGTIGHVLVSLHFVQTLESVRRLSAAELRDVGWPVGRQLHPNGIRHADLVERGGKQVWPVRDAASDRDAAGAATVPREPRRRRVLVPDQILGARNEVPPGIRLGQQLA